MPTPGITLNNLTLSYSRHPAVHHLTGRFPKGSMTAIMGPNGGGKSTLMKALAGLHPIDEGSIDRSSDHQLQQTAYLPQYLDWDRQFPLGVWELAAQGLITELPFWRGPSPDQSSRIQKALEQVGLWDLRHQNLGALSLGQFQRALFARVIVQSAQVILLDEPLTGLDEKSSREFFDLLHQWHQRDQKTLVVVLHDRLLALKHFPTTLILSQDAVAWGPTAEVLEPSLWETTLDKYRVQFSESECAR